MILSGEKRENIFNIYFMNCKQCKNEIEGRKGKEYCSIKCRNLFNTKKYRKENNLHTGKVGRPELKWLTVSEMTEENCIKFNESKNGRTI